MPPKVNKSQKEAAHQNQPKQKKKKQQNKPPKVATSQNVTFYCSRPGCKTEFHCSESEHVFYVHSAGAPVNMPKNKKSRPFHCSLCKPTPRYFCSEKSLSDHIKVHDRNKKKQQSK